MTVGLKEFTSLKSGVERLQRIADKAQGALDQTMAILKENFDCDTIEEAHELAKQYEEDADKLEAKFKKSQTKFMDKWGDKLA